MSSIWQSFIPHHIARDLALHPDADPVGREQRFEAAVLFADISGFTAISEALAATGRTGAEELTGILNSYFGSMIDLVGRYGGIVGKFGGDAMTVLFPCESGPPSDTVRRTIQCALEMQQQVGSYSAIRTSGGTFDLTTRIGLAWGSVYCTTVGDRSLRLETIVAGIALDRAAEAELCAGRGEVVAQRAMLDWAGPLDPFAEWDDFVGVARLASPVEPAPLRPLPPLAPQAIRTVRAFVHPSTAARIDRGQAAFINEPRKVSVLFTCFGGFDYDGGRQVGARLQAYFSQVIRVVHRYDGYLNKVQTGDKGSHYVVLFGAPIAHEDDEQRALRCALDLSALPDAPVGIGVTTGFVFCGQVGSAVRQEYTVIGDAVNLAARLMQTAQPGQILAGEATYTAGQDLFTWQPASPIRVKGKSQPIQSYLLAALKPQRRLRLQELEYTLPMVGRAAEMELLQARLMRVLEGKGQIVGITAEAGMGKSRLAAEVARSAIQAGLVGYGGECLSHGTHTSYLVWRNLLRDLFDLDTFWPAEKQLGVLETRLAEVDPGLVQRMPLLGLPLNLPIPENELTRGLQARERKDSVEALIVDCLRHRARAHPLLLVLEDCHWIDPLSNDLLESVGRNVSDLPVLLVVVYRPPEGEQVQPRIARFGHFFEIRLAQYDRRETERLIGLKLRQLYGIEGSVPPEFVDRIAERAQGNPFFIDEMVNLIHDRNPDPGALQTLRPVDLPDSLHSLIISRIDQLAEGAKITLKVASVIGRLFRASWLWGAYPPLGTPEQVKSHLEQLGRLDIALLDKTDPELEYLFKHIITREVAYQSLAVSTRAMLHEQIGLFIERVYPDTLDLFLDLLAHHFGLSTNTCKRREYLHRAGVAAQAAYANEAAINYFQRLLPLLEGGQQADVMLQLGEVWQLVGRWDQAEALFRQALEIADQICVPRTQANSQQAIGTLLRLKGAYAEALTWLESARAGFDALGDRRGLGDVLREIGILSWNQSQFSDALSCFQQCLSLARELNDDGGVYRAIGNMGLVYWTRGDRDQAIACYEQCHRIATDLGDRLGVGKNHTNLGNVYLDQGDYPRALASFAKSLQMAQEVGIRQGIGISVGNMGDVYEKHGDYASALACFAFSLQTALEIGELPGVSFSSWQMARVFLAQGQHQIAGRLLGHAIDLARILDSPYELCEYLDTQAELLVSLGEYLRARRLNKEALETAGQVDHRDVQLRSAIRDVRLQVVLKELPEQAGIRTLDAMLGQWPDDAAQAAIKLQIWHLDPQQEHCRRSAAALYRSLYQRTPGADYRNRYQALTGERLPELPALPLLPHVVASRAIDLASMLDRISALVSTVPPGGCSPRGSLVR